MLIKSKSANPYLSRWEPWAAEVKIPAGLRGSQRNMTHLSPRNSLGRRGNPSRIVVIIQSIGELCVYSLHASGLWLHLFSAWFPLVSTFTVAWEAGQVRGSRPAACLMHPCHASLLIGANNTIIAALIFSCLPCWESTVEMNSGSPRMPAMALFRRKAIRRKGKKSTCFRFTD